MLRNSKLNSIVSNNFLNVKFWLLIPPFILLLLIFLFFVFNNKEGNFVDLYINVQEDLFFYLNSKLSVFPSLQFNLTQLGDVLISFSLVAIFIVYAPRSWGALLVSAILSLIVSAGLKKLFAVPRPAAIFDIDSFVIIGRTLAGRTSLPSGHSIATFVLITILLFAFMPKKNSYKLIWTVSILSLGMFIAFSRVGVGAHYPLDVIIGSIIGYIVSVLGIMIDNKVRWPKWIYSKIVNLIFIILVAIWVFIIVEKLITTNLLIFYISVVSLVITIYLMISTYVKKYSSK